MMIFTVVNENIEQTGHMTERYKNNDDDDNNNNNNFQAHMFSSERLDSLVTVYGLDGRGSIPGGCVQTGFEAYPGPYPGGTWG
jgi:hypothetical protein